MEMLHGLGNQDESIGENFFLYFRVGARHVFVYFGMKRTKMSSKQRDIFQATSARERAIRYINFSSGESLPYSLE
jgi:hypothetical protein